MFLLEAPLPLGILHCIYPIMLNADLRFIDHSKEEVYSYQDSQHRKTEEAEKERFIDQGKVNTFW